MTLAQVMLELHATQVEMVILTKSTGYIWQSGITARVDKRNQLSQLHNTEELFNTQYFGLGGRKHARTYARKDEQGHT